MIPDIPGLDDPTVQSRVHTSDTVMRIDDLPTRLLIIGGGYIASEFAHVFASFGTTVIQAVRGDRLLPKHDRDVSAVVHRRRRAPLRPAAAHHGDGGERATTRGVEP